MGLTLSHLSALDVTRKLRSVGSDLMEFEATSLRTPAPWSGRRWNRRTFANDRWRWMPPSPTRPLDVLLPEQRGRIRMDGIACHSTWQILPPRSILWLDEYSSMVCPELMFLQASEVLPLPALVALGYELCGYFSRDALDPRSGEVAMHVPPATSVERIKEYLGLFRRGIGLARARDAIRYVSDGALSAPEAVLATMYSLPVEESGYGMGPVTLNQRVDPINHEHLQTDKTRFPDLLFSFAPVGINYDGGDHLDLPGLVIAAQDAARATGEDVQRLRGGLAQKLEAVRAKYLDDLLRNRQLATRGLLVFPATKEDLIGWGRLDAFTRDLLRATHSMFGLDTTPYELTLEDTEQTRDRNATLASLLPCGRANGGARDLL